MSVECQIPELYKKALPQTIIGLPIVTTLQWIWSFIKGKPSSNLSTMQPDYKHQLLSHSQSWMQLWKQYLEVFRIFRILNI